MKKFSELGIKPATNLFVGDKIKINKVLNKEIEVLAYRLEESKFPKNKSGKCLHLQIRLDDEKRVLFTGSDVLIGTVQQIPEEAFPFSTVLIKEGEHYEFS